MFVLISSIVISTIIALFGLYLFKKLNILDTPWKYKDLKRKTPVPRLMGIFLILSVLVSIIFLTPSYWEFKEVQALFVWAIFLAIIAVIDDVYGIKAKWRFLIQIMVAFIWIAGGAIISHFNFLGHIVHVPIYLGIFLSLIWFVLIINAFNWFDGINAMWAWVSTIWFFTIALVIKFIIFPNYHISPVEMKHLMLLLNLSLILTGVSFVFTLMEMEPWGLLRDVGIMFLGYVLAYLSLFSWAKVWILLVVLSLVIFDAFWVIINRIKNKKNPMKWDYRHFHHRLMKHGWTREEIRAFVWIWSIFFMVLILLQWTNTINKTIIFIMVFIIFFWTHIYLYWIKKIPQGLWDRDND